MAFDQIQLGLSKITRREKDTLSAEEFSALIAILRGANGHKEHDGQAKVDRPRMGSVQEMASLNEASISVKRNSAQTSSNGKRMTRINGATESSSHTLDDEELEQFAAHLQSVSASDKALSTRPAVTADSFFESCQDGLLLCKLINDSVPDTIDDRVLNVGSKLNAFQMTENINVAINSAKAIGCSVVNIGATDIIEGREHLVLGLVWQVIKLGLLAKINLQFHPELTRLLEDDESLEDFLKLPADSILLRWFNFQLSKAKCDRIVTNFTTDLSDSICYINLLQQLAPETCLKSGAQSITDATVRAEKVVEYATAMGCDKYISVASILRGNHRLNLAFVANLFNHYPGLERLSEQEMAALDDKLFDSDGDRESRTFALWMNSLGVEPFVRNIPEDLRDGNVLLQVINHISPGSVNLVVGKKPTRFQSLENTNQAVNWCRRMKFSLVGIQGADLTDGNKKLTLAIVWQLMRQHIIETLKALSKNGREVTDDDILSWANSNVAGQKISSFKDPQLRSGRFMLELMNNIQRGIVNFDLVHDCPDDEAAKANGKYAISVARKLGATIFLLPEDIVQVQPRMLLTFIGTLMAISLSRSKTQ